MGDSFLGVPRISLDFEIWWEDFTKTRWWFQICFIFTPIGGRWTLFWRAYFSDGWFNHQLEDVQVPNMECETWSPNKVAGYFGGKRRLLVFFGEDSSIKRYRRNVCNMIILPKSPVDGQAPPCFLRIFHHFSGSMLRFGGSNPLLGFAFEVIFQGSSTMRWIHSSPSWPTI